MILYPRAADQLSYFHSHFFPARRHDAPLRAAAGLIPALETPVSESPAISGAARGKFGADCAPLASLATPIPKDFQSWHVIGLSTN